MSVNDVYSPRCQNDAQLSTVTPVPPFLWLMVMEGIRSHSLSNFLSSDAGGAIIVCCWLENCLYLALPEVEYIGT